MIGQVVGTGASSLAPLIATLDGSMPLVVSACFCILTLIVFLIFLPEPGNYLPREEPKEED